MIINVQKNLPQSDEFTFTAIDFERANNSQNSVCQVGICAVERGRIIKSCEYLVRPPQRVFYFQKKAMEIHGITYLDVEDALTFDKVWKKILPYIEGRPLVAHSFRDDAMTMDAILSSYRIKYHYERYGHLCTLEAGTAGGYSRRKQQIQPGGSLRTLRHLPRAAPRRLRRRGLREAGARAGGRALDSTPSARSRTFPRRRISTSPNFLSCSPIQTWTCWKTTCTGSKIKKPYSSPTAPD